MSRSASAVNQALYDEFWSACPDFSRYNPGILHRRRVILDLLHRLPFESLLDVGCGDAQLLLCLRSYFPKATFAGADLSPVTVADNQRRYGFARFHVLNVEHERLDEQADVVVCTEVIEHLDDRPGALKNLAAMVKPGGRLLLTCPTGKVHATERHFGHVAHPRPGELEAMLEGVGLQVEHITNWGFPLYSAMKYATNVRAEWALKNFAGGSYSPFAKFVSKSLYWINYLNMTSSPWGCQVFAIARRPSTG